MEFLVMPQTVHSLVECYSAPNDSTDCSPKVCIVWEGECDGLSCSPLTICDCNAKVCVAKICAAKGGVCTTRACTIKADIMDQP